MSGSLLAPVEPPAALVIDKREPRRARPSIGGLACFLAWLAAVPISQAAETIDFAGQRDCVRTQFFRQVAPGTAIDASLPMSRQSIRSLAREVAAPMRKALSTAADETFRETRQTDPGLPLDPAKTFDVFLDHLATDLPHRFSLARCGAPDISADALFDVAINEYIGQLLGNGATHRWFVEHGGDQASTSFVAAMIGVELSGRDLVTDDWERYYTRYVRLRFHPGSASQPAR